MTRVTVVPYKPIVPDKMFFDNKKFVLTKVDPEFVIKIYDIFLDRNNCVRKLSLLSKHPNCDPKTKLFCLPNFVKENEFNEAVKCMIYYCLSTFNLENCYFMPWGNCEYQRM